MPRLLEPVVKQELLSQLKQGISINKISKTLGIAKSTIYPHYEKLNGKKYVQPIFTPESSELEGEICGIFAGDGSQYFEPKKFSYEVNVHFGGHKLSYAQYVQELFQIFFNKKFRLRSEKSGALRLRTQSKKIFNYFQNYLDYAPAHKHDTVCLKNLALPEQFRRGFLRGLIDTDGSVLFDKNQRIRIIYHTTSKILAQQLQALLSHFYIQSTLQIYNHALGYKQLYRVNIRSRSIDTFLKGVKPFKAQGLVVKPGITRPWQG